MLTPEHIKELTEAKRILEGPGFAIKLANKLGKVVEVGLGHLPDGVSEKILGATQSALEKSMDAASWTLDPVSAAAPSNMLHKVGVAATGLVAGAFGLPGVLIEIPISTTMMLRSIAEVARSEGEDLSSDASRLACISVFALGGESPEDDASESAYYMLRMSLASAVNGAAIRFASQTSGKVTGKAAGTAMERALIAVAERLSVQLSEKAAAGFFPLVGAIGASGVNVLFIDHFQDAAKGHFVVRRLERHYGEDAVEKAYREIPI